MKETVCPFCGEKNAIPEDIVVGRHVRCAHCEAKFSYLTDSAPFSAERLVYAIAECRKDSERNQYYNAAPAGARLYIGLLFYGLVFADGMNADDYATAMAEVEPELKISDWEYLLAHEKNPALAEYFKNKINLTMPKGET